METLLLNNISFEEIPPNLFQNFKNATIFTSEKVVMAAYTQKLINDFDIKILKYLFKLKFVTFEQLYKLLNQENATVLNERINILLKGRYINEFSFSKDKDESFDYSKEAFTVYVLDVAGHQLLSHLLNDLDLFDWLVYDNIQNSEVIQNRLISNEAFISIEKSVQDLVEFRYNPETRTAAKNGYKLVRPSFHLVTFNGRTKEYFLGETVVFEDFINGNLRERLNRLQGLIEFDTFKKDYMDIDNIPPTILFICPTDKQEVSLISEMIDNSGLENCFLTSLNRLEKTTFGNAFMKSNGNKLTKIQLFS